MCSLSTLHHDANVQIEENEYQLKLFDYNNYTKVGVDLMDQKLSYYRFGRGCRRWTLAVFFNLPDICPQCQYCVARSLSRMGTTPKRQASFPSSRSQQIACNASHSWQQPCRIQRPILRAILPSTGEFHSPAHVANAALSYRTRCEICGRSCDKTVFRRSA